MQELQGKWTSSLEMSIQTQERRGLQVILVVLGEWGAAGSMRRRRISDWDGYVDAANGLLELLASSSKSLSV